MMSQNVPIKLTLTRIDKPIRTQSANTTLIVNKDKVQIDEYKEFFASLFKIKDKDVQRRVLQAVNGHNLTCANCANKIEASVPSVVKQSARPSTFTQTLAKDFEFLEKINRTSKRFATMSTTSNSSNDRSSTDSALNKIQLGRTKRKFEPYAVKIDKEKCIVPDSKKNYLQQKHEPDSILNKIRKPDIKSESKPLRSTSKNSSITEKLLLDHLDSDQMSPHGFFNFKSNEQPTIFNDFFFVSTLEEDMRMAGVHNDEGLYTMHIATIEGDLFRLRRIILIFRYFKWDVDIRSKDGKSETALHFAMSSTNNARNNEIINLLYDKGADVLATNDAGDTVLHLAAETINDYGMITKLISKINLDDLSKRNDKSQTILHIAAASKNRTFVKCILSFIDDKLNISSIGKGITFTNADAYFKELDEIHLNYVKTFISESFHRPTIHPIKAKILNEQDERSGKTAIFLSLENNDQSSCLLLLAHFADTRIQDFNNTTCAYYSTEISKNRILAQAIYNADSMHNVVVSKPLKQTEKHRSFESRKRLALMQEDDDRDVDIMSKVTKVLS